jgi:hypothetical protein
MIPQQRTDLLTMRHAFVAANNGPTSPLVMKNPCGVQGRALPPGAYVTQGQQANASTTNFLLDVSMGWPKGDYLDPQPLASGNVFQNQAYGNYVFGVYMAAAGSELSVASGGERREHHKRI